MFIKFFFLLAGSVFRAAQPLISTKPKLILIAVAFERAFNRHIDIVRLGLGQLGNNTTEAAHHMAGNLFVEMLGQHFHTQKLSFGGIVLGGKLALVEIDLGQHLIGKGAIHNTAWVTGGIAQVDQAALG